MSISEITEDISLLDFAQAIPDASHVGSLPGQQGYARPYHGAEEGDGVGFW